MEWTHSFSETERKTHTKNPGNRSYPTLFWESSLPPEKKKKTSIRWVRSLFLPIFCKLKLRLSNPETWNGIWGWPTQTIQKQRFLGAKQKKSNAYSTLSLLLVWWFMQFLSAPQFTAKHLQENLDLLAIAKKHALSHVQTTYHQLEDNPVGKWDMLPRPGNVGNMERFPQ